MKKTLCLLVCVSALLFLMGCAANDSAPVQPDIDLDLTQMSGTMVYAEVYNMLMSPEDYLGKTVKMSGVFNVWQDTVNNKNYYACIISDATACCAQGIEFERKGNYVYPAEYPELDQEITVTGVFETYEEDGTTFCRLKDAELLFS